MVKSYKNRFCLKTQSHISDQCRNIRDPVLKSEAIKCRRFATVPAVQTTLNVQIHERTNPV